MTHENIAGKDWRQIRLIMESITEFIVKLHELGFMHGDLKPLNIVRDGGRMKCIDLDASVSFVEKQFAGDSPCLVREYIPFSLPSIYLSLFSLSHLTSTIQ